MLVGLLSSERPLDVLLLSASFPVEYLSASDSAACKQATIAKCVFAVVEEYQVSLHCFPILIPRGSKEERRTEKLQRFRPLHRRFFDTSQSQRLSSILALCKGVMHVSIPLLTHFPVEEP